MGEETTAVLQKEPELPESLRTQINRLRKLEEQHHKFQRLSVGQASPLTGVGQHR